MSRLLVREKLLAMTGKDFEVKAGIFAGPVYSIVGDIASPHDKRILYDGDDRSILKMRTKIISAHGTMFITDARTRTRLVTMRRKHVVPIKIRGGGVVHVWKGEYVENVSPWLEIDGEFEGDTFLITDLWRGVDAAIVRRKQFTLSGLIFGKSSYIVEVHHEYDEALMVLLTVAIDEYYNS